MQVNSKQLEEFLDTQVILGTEREHPSPSAILTTESISEYIFHQVTRASFRRTRLDEASASDLKRKIFERVKRGEPITFSVPFGGYKNYKIASFPGPDWAEVFNLNYTARYVAPIVKYYEPGASIHYSYTSGVLDIVSNMRSADTQQYMREFRVLLSLFAAHLPFNLRINAVDISEMYDREELLHELRRNYDDNRQRWNDKFTSTERNRHIASAQRNLMRLGVANLQSLTDEEWDNRCVDAAMWCEALDSLSKRRHFNKYSSNIQLVHVRGPALSIHIASCDTSAHHFPAGCGLVEVRGTRLLQRILSEPKRQDYRKAGMITDVAVNTRFGVVSPAFNNISVIYSPRESGS
jgi:hypothetical protein